jgi:ABC-type amino acid transport substrate-binding protein
VVLDIPIAIYLGARHEADGIVLIPHALATEYLAWAVSKGNPVLLDEINTILSGWRKDGTLDGFLKRWIPRYDLFALEEASPSN